MVELYFSDFFDCFVILGIWHKFTGFHGKCWVMGLAAAVIPRSMPFTKAVIKVQARCELAMA
jgi:hypothetical protein